MISREREREREREQNERRSMTHIIVGLLTRAGCLVSQNSSAEELLKIA